MSKKDEAVRFLINVHKVFAVVFVLLGVATVLFMKAVRLPWSIAHLTSDALASQNHQTVFVPANHHVWDIPLWFSVCTVLFLAALYAVLVATSLKNRYTKDLNQRVMPIRWIGMGVLAGLMVKDAGMLSGIQDVVMLVFMSGAVIVTCILGWLAEKQNRTARRPDWTAFRLSLLTGAAAWLPIVFAAIGTLVWGMIRSPWYVYVLYLVLLVGSLGLAWNQWKGHQKKRQWKDYLFVERNYVLMQYLTITLFTVVLIIGLHK